MADKNRSIPEDEIDFASLGSRLYNFLAYPSKLLLGNLLVSASFAFAAVLIAVSLKYIIPKRYESSFIISPNDRNEKLHVKLLKDIEVLQIRDDNEGLARELKLDISTVQSIKSFEVSSLLTLKSRLDSVNATEVKLGLSDYTQFAAVQNAVLNYLENNPYYAKITSVQKANLELKLKMVDRDLTLIDSLKRLQLSSYEKTKVNDPNSLYLKYLLNPTTTYTLGFERLSQKTALNWQRSFINNFEVVKSVVDVRKHVWPPRILIMCLVLVPLSLVFCLIYLNQRSRRQNS